MSKMLYKKIKRILDIIFSSILLLFFSPLLLLVYILIWIEDRSEVFVKQPIRLGVNGKEFKMYKFRSMVPNAHEKILNNPKYSSLKKKWSGNDRKLSIKEDDRITKIGKVLRSTDIDELPQLLNVFKGDMSIVGPRPMYKLEIEEHLKSYPEDKKKIETILSVKPGMTGIWQVSGRNDIIFKDRVVLESEYSENYNLLADAKIFFLTPYVILTRKGVHG